ncbi:MAG: flagellar basal body L-ring protein FlgH [Gammaproteobacteria bacterium]|nr:MAG: flagellar basal body L-ring protein FlgH [Gammaproteobacteria bacterium]
MNVQRLFRLLLPVLALGLASGCATRPVHEVVYRPAMPPVVPEPPQRDGAIYQEGREVSLFTDLKAHRVGDVLTIVLQEKTQAKKTAQVKTSKDSKVSLPNPTVLGKPTRFDVPLLPHGRGGPHTLETNADSSNTFEGKGDSTQSNSLTGSITVTVARVLPNGNLVVQGEKWLTINTGEEYIRISGIVRPADIRPDNTVLSTQVADARITYSGKGEFADSNRMGWLARFFMSPLWPF